MKATRVGVGLARGGQILDSRRRACSLDSFALKQIDNEKAATRSLALSLAPLNSTKERTARRSSPVPQPGLPAGTASSCSLHGNGAAVRSPVTKSWPLGHSLLYSVNWLMVARLRKQLNELMFTFYINNYDSQCVACVKASLVRLRAY